MARVGNSTDDQGFFYGRETPDEPSQPAQPSGTYKDGKGAIKRQAARFRVHGYDKDDKVLGESTHGGDCTIDWEVHLANKKARPGSSSTWRWTFRRRRAFRRISSSAATKGSTATT